MVPGVRFEPTTYRLQGERARRLAINADPHDNSADSPSAERAPELSAANVTIVKPKTGETLDVGSRRDRSSDAGTSDGAASTIKASACRDDSDNSDNRTSVVGDGRRAR